MRRFFGSLLVLVVFVFVVVVYLFVQLPSAGESGMITTPREAIARVGDAAFRVEVADTPALRSRGLSGRALLAKESGMLFVFENPARYRFTMSGMRFSLDFVWIREGRVVGITENAAPETFIVEPPESVDMVLEINAGLAVEFGVKAGDAMVIEK